MKIAIVPFSTELENNKIFNPTAAQNRDDCLGPYREMKQELLQNGAEIFTADQERDSHIDILIFLRFDLKYLLHYVFRLPNVRLIYMAFEPPVVQPLHYYSKLKLLSKVFDIVFTFYDDLVDNKQFQKLYYPVSMSIKKTECLDYQSRELITAIVGDKKSKRKGELYSSRREALTFFTNKYPTFKFYGSAWSQKEFSSYAGPVQNKQVVLSGYKFAICFENQRELVGLISEKIFDCFYAQVVPVYIGAKNVEEYFPPLTFIDGRKFENYEALNAYILGMSEEEYSLRISAINEYLKSPNRKLFTGQKLAQQILNLESKPKTVSKYFRKSIIAIFLFISLWFQKVLHKLKKLTANTFAYLYWK